jgi:hypothetical protein
MKARERKLASTMGEFTTTLQLSRKARMTSHSVKEWFGTSQLKRL